MAETITEMIEQGQDVTTTLSEVEKLALEKFEADINRGLGTFLEVGQALAEIRDRRLYRATHKDFDRYCKDRWDLGKAYANRQIRGYETVLLLESKMAPIGAESEMAPIGVISDSDMDSPTTSKEIILPINEAQTRSLTKLKNPDDQVKAWSLVLDELNQNPNAKLTSSLIKKAVKAVRGEIVKKKIEASKIDPKTSLLTKQFKNQHQVLLDIVVAAKNAGWVNDKRSEVIKYLKALVAIAESDD